MYKYANEQVNVPLKRLQTVGFTEEDVEVHKDLFSYDVYRKAFGDENGVLEDYNLRFVGPRILNLKDIKNDSTFDHSQPYRAGKNPEHDAIFDSIKEDGYALNELAPAVIRTETATYMWGDGRTRGNSLKIQDVENCLANVYEVLKTDEVSMAKTRRFGMMLNTLGKTKGKATEEDVETFLTHQARKPKNGNKSQLELLHGEMNSTNDLVKALGKELKASNMKMSTNKVKRLACQLFEKYYGKTEVVTFKGAKDCLSYLQEKWGPEWTDNEERVLYVTAADGKHGLTGSLEKLFSMRENGDNRRLDVVLYETDVSTKDPEDQFLNKKMLKAKDKMLSRLKVWSDEVYGGAEFNTSNLNFVAAVPYVVSLNDQYPLEQPLYL